MTTDKSNESSKRLDEWNSRVNEFLEAVLPDGDRDSHPVPFPVEDPPVASTITKEENAPNLIETKGSPVDLISPHVGIYPQCRLVPISTAPTTTTSKSDTTKSSHVPTRSTEPTRYVSKCHGTSIRKCSLRRLSGWEKEYEDTEQEIDKEWDPNWDEFLDIKHYKSWCKNFNKHKTTTSIKCVATTATVKCTTSSSPIKCSASSVPIPTTTAIAKSSILTSTKVQTTTTEITAQPSPTSEPPKSITSTCALKRDTFCLYVSEKDGQAYFTIHAAGKGWSGIGMGASRRMLGTDMYIAWQGTYGSWVHSRRRAMKNEMPQVMEVQFITPRPIQVAPPPWANLAYSFSRPTRVGENVISADSRYIYAYGDSPGFQRDDWRSGFAMHSEKGLLPPLSYGGQAPTVNSTTTATQQFTAEYRNVVMIHGILMFVAWGVIPFAGIFIARFMKARWPEAWLKIHMGLMAGVTGLLTGLAFIFIATTKSENHFEEPHTILGLTVVVCTLTQLCFGSLSASLWDEDMKSPWYNALHRWFGRVSLILGITNIYLGIEKYCSLMGYNESFVAIAAGYWVWIFCSTLVLVVTQYIFAPAQLIRYNSRESSLPEIPMAKFDVDFPQESKTAQKTARVNAL